MLIHKVNDRVAFGTHDELTGTIVGHGIMVSPAGSTLLTYAIRLDEQFQGFVGDDYHPNKSFISTMLACSDGVKPEAK